MTKRIYATPTGRPPKFKDPIELQKKIDAYFENCEKKSIPLTITGLAIALDTDRQTLCEYAKKPDFTDTIKKAKVKVENDYELALRKNGRAGDIFGLKNFGWTDKTETEISGEITVKWDE